VLILRKAENLPETRYTVFPIITLNLVVYINSFSMFRCQDSLLAVGVNVSLKIKPYKFIATTFRSRSLLIKQY
jgi:hypothetical protein